MVTKVIQVENLDASSLLAMFARIEAQISEIKELSQTQQPEQWLSRVEVAEMLKVSLVTVHAWANKGFIKPYKMGSKTRFKLSEINKALSQKNCDVL